MTDTCPVVTCQPPGPASLTGQVAVLDQETVLVNWTVFHQDQQVLGREIVDSPVRARYGSTVSTLRMVVLQVLSYLYKLFLCGAGHSSNYVLLPASHPHLIATMVDILVQK